MSHPAPLLLTGASGWFGRTALHVYEQAHGPEALRREVIPFASRERWVEFGSSHGPVKAHPLEAILDVSNPGGLLHLAFLTRDKVEELGHRRYVAGNRAIMATLARLLQAWPAMPVVATSSGAAAALDGLPADLAGNPYATLKQEEEVLLERQGATRMAVVFRVYAASGRFMTRPQKFALGDLILQGLRGEPLRVKAPHAVWRSYGSVEQLMQLSWLLLQGGPDLAGGPGFRRLDACGPAVELAELAAGVAAALGASLAPRTISSAAGDHYGGDGEAFAPLLHRHGLTPRSLRQQIADTISGLRLTRARLQHSHPGIAQDAFGPGPP